MGDVVVTVPKSFGLDTWIAEGDAAGEPWSGEEWHFYLGGSSPDIKTIPEFIQGFRGARYRWWDTTIEVPFPGWQKP